MNASVPHRIAIRLRGPARTVAILLATLALATGASRAQSANVCDNPGEAPDVIVGDLQDLHRWGVVGGITAFSVGTFSCNIGSCWLNWFGQTEDHPVIGQNLDRWEDGRFEQIGQSWLKHAFLALDLELCETGCIGTNGDHLGVNCSDPYSASLNGYQGGLGPKSEVNAATGEFPFPPTDAGASGDVIYKRLQVHTNDLEPYYHPQARYYIEGQYVAADDAAAGNALNNASYREVEVSSPSPGNLVLSFVGSTVRESPGLFAWQLAEPGVILAYTDVPGDGRIYVGTKVTDLGDGSWAYEYAVYNYNSHRAVRAFTVPVPATGGVADVGFHDVDYHSGEPFDGTDWNVSTSGAAVTWATQPWAANPNANAVRWGTLYNYRFTATVPPGPGQVKLGMFRPGGPDEIALNLTVPCDRGFCAVQVPASTRLGLLALVVGVLLGIGIRARSR